MIDNDNVTRDPEIRHPSPEFLGKQGPCSLVYNWVSTRGTHKRFPLNRKCQTRWADSITNRFQFQGTWQLLSLPLFVYLYNSVLQCVSHVLERAREGLYSPWEKIKNCRIEVSLNYTILLKRKENKKLHRHSIRQVQVCHRAAHTQARKAIWHLKGVDGYLRSSEGSHDGLDGPPLLNPVNSQWCQFLTDSVRSSVWRVWSVLFWTFSSGRRNTDCRSDECQSRAVLLGCAGAENRTFSGGSPGSLATPLRLHSNSFWNLLAAFAGVPGPGTLYVPLGNIHK